MPEPKTYTEDELKSEIAKAQEGIRNDLSSERKAKADLEKRLKALEDEVTNAKSEKEKADLEAKGKYDEALKKYQEESEKKIAEYQKTIEALTNDKTALLVDGEILKHAAGANNPEDVLIILKAMYNFEVDGKNVKIKTKDGSPLLDKSAKEATIEYAVNTLFEERSHLKKPDGISGSGGKANLNIGNKEDLSKLSPSEKIALGHEMSKKT